MNKKAVGYSLWFYLPAMIATMLFPKQTVGNIYFMSAYLGVSLVFIYLIFFRKKPAE
jgi:hypothetical protein